MGNKNLLFAIFVVQKYEFLGGEFFLSDLSFFVFKLPRMMLCSLESENGRSVRAPPADFPDVGVSMVRRLAYQRDKKLTEKGQPQGARTNWREEPITKYRQQSMAFAEQAKRGSMREGLGENAHYGGHRAARPGMLEL